MRSGSWWLGLGLSFFLWSCETPEPETGEMEAEEGTPAMTDEEPSAAGELPEKERAIATLEAKSGSELTGEAFFVEEEDGRVSFGVHVANVTPGTHAVHIHEFGDCSAPDASSAGDHWNPTNEQHGKWGEEAFHLGDIGNIEVGEEGDGSLSMTTDLWSLEEMGENSVLGKAVVVHAGADDFETQPDGGAGERIGCGVIEWKQQPTTEPTEPTE